jgi:hypothetical protein
MSELSNKYNIPESAVKNMIKDGWITCSVSKWEEIYQCFKATKQATGKCDQHVAVDVSAKMGISERWVIEIVKKFQ